jgi:O-antigen ligase
MPKIDYRQKEAHDMAKPVLYLLYAFAFATVLAMSATSIVLALFLIFFFKDLFKKTIRMGDFKKDSLLYVALYSWKAFTRALAKSIRDIPKIKGVWDRVPYIVIGFYQIHNETVIKIFHILFIANTVIILYALGQHFFGIPAIYKPLFFDEDSSRLSGYFGHPNQYGGCISIIFIMNICLALYQNKRFFSYSPFLLVGLIYSSSRSYFLGVFICLVILLALTRSFKTILKYSVILVLIIAVIALTVPWFSQRIEDSFSLDKNMYRLNFWIISWNVFLEHPIAGVGSGMLPGYLEPFKEKGLIDNTAHAHNLYLHELAENGIPGFILVIGTHIYFLVKYFKLHCRTSEPLLKAISLGVALAFVNLLVAGIFENNFGAAIVAMNINFLMGVLEGYRLTEQKTHY